MDDDDEADAIAAATRALESRVFVVARERVDGGGEDARGAAATAAAVASRLQLHRDDSSSSRSVVLCRSTATYRALARRVPREGERCADVGSAHGDATAALAAAVGDASLVVGVDVSAAFVELSRSRHPTIRFERLDALEDPALLARHLAGAACVFVDVGGVRPAEALVRLLPSIAKSADPRVVVVKCEALYDEAVAVAAAAPHPDDVKCEALYDEAVAVVAAAPHPDDALNERPLPMRFWNDVCVRETKNVRARSAFKRTHEAKSAAPAAPGVFDRYPLKYPPRFVTSAADGVTREACRFHNYSKQGCLKRIRGDACPHDHERCHWCGEAGHVASACDDARRARDRAVVSEGLAPGAAPIRDPNDGTAGVTSRAAGVTSRAAITSGDGDAVDDDDGYVYVAGGRNRGRTVGVTERYSIARGRWERGPHMEHPRGSHALAACGGVVYAVAGGGVKSVRVRWFGFSIHAFTRSSFGFKRDRSTHRLTARSTTYFLYYTTEPRLRGGAARGRIDDRPPPRRPRPAALDPRRQRARAEARGRGVQRRRLGRVRDGRVGERRRVRRRRGISGSPGYVVVVVVVHVAVSRASQHAA